MDADRFDHIAGLLKVAPSRRAVLALFSGLGLMVLPVSEAARGRRKKNRRGHGGGGCPGGYPLQCPPRPSDPNGYCIPAGAVCCPSSSSLHTCPQAYPNCCAPTPQDPQGLCIPSGYKCCSASQGGGACLYGATCCPPIAGYPDGYCAPPGYTCFRSAQVDIERVHYRAHDVGVAPTGGRWVAQRAHQ